MYVTASPLLYEWREEIDVTFHESSSVWYDDDWDDDHGTVLPEMMADHVRRAVEASPRKRVIGHFLQPRYPYVGAGSRLNTQTFEDDITDASDVWAELMYGRFEVSADEVWRTYRRNLDLALALVEGLLSDLQGRTVVTADNGNVIGERVTVGPDPGVEPSHRDAHRSINERPLARPRKLLSPRDTERNRNDDRGSCRIQVVDDRLMELENAV